MVAHEPIGVGGVAVGRQRGAMVWHCVFSINRKQYAKQQLNLRIFCQFSPPLFLCLTAYYSG